MNCPIKLPVFEAGTEVGTLEIQQTGLYYHFSCRCTPPKAAMSRLYAVNGMQVLPIGLPVPENGSFVLEKSISVHSFPWQAVTAALVGTALSPDVLPWRGEIDGVPIENAWLQKTGEGYTLCVPSAEPFPLTAELERAELVTVGGIDCLCLRLDAAGDPVHTEI